MNEADSGVDRMSLIKTKERERERDFTYGVAFTTSDQVDETVTIIGLTTDRDNRLPRNAQGLGVGWDSVAVSCQLGVGFDDSTIGRCGGDDVQEACYGEEEHCDGGLHLGRT
jgi:hypothetical protein